MPLNYTASSSSKLIYAGAGVSLLLSGLGYWYYKQYKKHVMPLKWRRIGILEQLNFFPIKSCAPLNLPDDTAVACEVLGLRLDGFRDRSLMLVDDKDEMITARIYPKMVLIETKKLSATKLLISAAHMPEDLILDFATLASEANGKDIHTAVWGSKLDAMLCGDKFDKWFSQCLLSKDNGLHLVYYPYPIPVRTTNARMLKEPYIIQADSGTFADATSYMLMNLASVNELNTRLTPPVDPQQFRGNFHLKMDNDVPFAEDNWSWLRIGDDAVFRIVAPCTRCILPNINVNTGERDPNFEPLKTLKSYRMRKGYASPAIGIHLGLRRAGDIKVNDVIYIEDK